MSLKVAVEVWLHDKIPLKNSSINEGKHEKQQLIKPSTAFLWKIILFET